MSEIVAVDTTSPPGGDQMFLVGVAVEIDDLEHFRSYYFNTIRDFLRSHNVQLPFPVIKSRTVLEHLPSYSMRDHMSELVADLIENPEISRINVSIGWYGDDVNLEYDGKDPVHGASFTSDVLSQYFEIVSLWRYHRSHERDLAPKAFVDNAAGKITPAWKYCGMEFDIDLIPNGDLTYPSISTADIIAYNLAGFLAGHDEDKFTEFPDLAEDYIINRRNWDTQPYIHAEAVNERYTDHIVPTLPHGIQDFLHYPHPVLFFHDQVLTGGDRSMLSRTDLHGAARKWAYENGGCVVNLKPDRLPSTVKNDDVIVYTKGTDPELPELLQDLHPTKDIGVHDSDELVEQLLNSSM
ncbi:MULTISPECIES: hypothetical protein [Halobacterium]|uniref:hypothetical protein n=1 Tax=Halobacterium TaxID=2239 RepID=UPI000AA8A4BD|nr:MULTISPECIES: hypothetical protein [Halobacterium]MCG1003925.1 hypothetical protein [Halobacterium noricense]